MPEDDSRSELRVGPWVPPYSPEMRSSKPPIRPTTPAAFPPAPIPGFPGWSRREVSVRRRAALVAAAVATLGVATVTALTLGDGKPPAEPTFVAGTVPAVPPLPPPAQTVIVAPTTSSARITTGSAPSSSPHTKSYSPSQPTKPAERSPTPTKTRSVTLSAGATVALTVADRTGYRVRHRNYLGRIDAIGASSDRIDRADSSFTVRGGLANSGCVSLESVNYPGYFLRHQNFEIKLAKSDRSDLFRQDATFCPVNIRSGAALTLRSLNYPKRFVVESGSRLYLRETTADAALALVPRAVN